AGFAIDRLAKSFGDQYLLIDAHIATETHDQAPSPVEDDLARTLAQVETFRRSAARSVAAWRAYFAEAKARREKVVLWGSGSKAVAFLTTLGLRDEVACVTDVNPYRHGKFVPGAGHEIVPPDELRTVRPARVVAMNPIYLGEIRAALANLGLAPELVALGHESGPA
ncbi:MAG: SAM-dependent methyltransferase, partial [Planctomycetes bacterium]|nr:SAM-dependent methyltransferase [Planctomycetota bacterium]